MKTQRDAFWERVYELAGSDRTIVVISEDMGAPALDRFRLDLPGQFINVGIAEQIGALLGGGLSLEGKRPFIYAIAPFVILRALEQIRVTNSIMGIPVTLVGVGAGFGYEDSGPTHHLMEDIAVMRAFPNIFIHSVSDACMASKVAERSVAFPGTNYVRLERKPLSDIYQSDSQIDFDKGFSVLEQGELCIVATGYMTHVAKEIAAEWKQTNGADVSVIDVFSIPLNETALADLLGCQRKILTIEEHFLPGGLGSYILEILNTHGICAPVERVGLRHEKGYSYVYGGRELIHEYYGIDRNSIRARVRKFFG